RATTQPGQTLMAQLLLGKGVIGRIFLELALAGLLLGACRGTPTSPTAPTASPAVPTSSAALAASASPPAPATPPATAQETDATLPLARAGGHWGVVFNPAVIWPDLVNGQKLYMVPFVPDRGTIYDRNGVPMATLTDTMAIGVVPGEIDSSNDNTASGLSRLL